MAGRPLARGVRGRRMHAILAPLVVSMLLLGCTMPREVAGGEARPSAEVRGTPKRVVAAIRGDGHTLSERINNVGGATVIGIGSVEELLNAALSTVDDRSALRPQLAEAVPSLENGGWRVFDDGRMETTWTIRAGARWHDGTPLTADDFAFTARVGADRDVGVFRDPAYDSIAGVETPDPRTVVVQWKRPFIEADAMFTHERGLPMPQHLLERDYLEDKSTFTNLPF